jgi:dipeptidyl aminopeptidase/acylaminoacyl peptidase
MLEYENPGDVMGWWADNDFQIRAKLRMLPDGGSQIWVKDSMQSDWRKALEFSADESGHSAQGFTADNKGLYVVSSVDSNAARLIEYRLEDGSQKVIAEDKQFDVSGILTNPINHELEAVYFTKERQYWHIVSKSIEADFAYLKTVCDGDFSLLSRSHDDNLWVVIYWMDNGPSRHYIYDRKAKKAEFLFTSKPSLEKFTMSKMQPISFIARDGMKIYGYLSLPAGYESQLSSDTAMAMTDEEKLPAVMLVHGGPWHRDSWGLHPEVQWLTNRGYAVLQINFRGSTGYGKDYLNAGDREWGAKMHDDLLDGKQWLIKQGYVHPKKIAIYGGSYGGYATLVGLAFTPDEFNCGVDIVGPSSIVTLINSIPPYWAPMKCIFDKRVGRVEEEREFLESRSPLHKADAIKAPLLIAQGANDPRVKQAESDQIVEAMRKNGKEVEYMLFEDEGHGFAKPENRMKFYAVAEKFLAKHLGGRSES